MILLDLGVADAAAAAALLSGFPPESATKIIVFSDRYSASFVHEIMNFGIAGFVPKNLGVNFVESVLKIVGMGGATFPTCSSPPGERGLPKRRIHMSRQARKI
ncbi:MAG: hypothetical protein K9G30_02265 [Parvibaculum sp.]|nr:hypothetical protein [Parvibaculum sp.]